ncbi:MsnO8 family LLM class oxidoreductase [Brachybacterium hainanense]|uniref:MsnO8 family LLM class oxidoreductase n=1 Tax=Brachybacterium hainanense TaxID=1541174 RepID=A0ABV6RD02_9MICO
MRLSLLDRSRTRIGEPESAALPHSVERARLAELAGYQRFWVAEHHAVPGIASGSPAVLLGAIGASTERIRLGTGGIMLPNHRPLLVAEQALMLASLFPGRVDLGLGRSLGFTEPVRRALGRLDVSPEEFAAEIAQVRAHLEGTAEITARPAADAPVPVHLLATGRGLDLAAQRGLPVVIGGPVLRSAELPARLAAYRRAFRPHRGSAPHIMLSADVLVADTDAEARELAVPEAWSMLESRRTGAFGPLEPVARIRERDLGARDRERLEQQVAAAWTGSEQTVARDIGQLLERTGTEELLASGSTYDRHALADSDRRLAAILG